MSQSQDFAVVLSEWLEKEMEYGGPVTADMLSRIAHGRSSAIFRHLVKKVQSKRTVETVLGNIALHSSQDQPKTPGLQLCPLPASTMSRRDRQKLLGKRERLLQQVNHLKSSKQHLSADTSLLRNSLVEKEHDVQDHRDRIAECRHQTCLLEQQALSCGQQLQKLNDTCAQLKTLIHDQQMKVKSASNTQYAAVGDSNVLESVQLQETRSVVQQTKEFLSHHYQAKSDQRFVADNEKQAIWSKTELLWHNFSAPVIVSSLKSIAVEHANRTAEQTNAIDLKADSEKLGLRGDGTSSPTVFYTLQNLIQASQVHHIEQFTSTQKLLTQANRQQQYLMNLLHEYHQQQQKTLSSQPQRLALSRGLIVAEVKRAGLEAELRQWQSSLRHDKEKWQQQRQERESLLATHQQISNFSKDVDKNQCLIADLVKYNSAAFDRLSNQQSKVQQYVSRQLTSHQSTITSNCAMLRDELLQASRSLLVLPLHRLLVDSSDPSTWCPVNDMCIHRVSNSSTSGANHHQPILRALRYPIFKSADSLLQHACDMLDTNATMQRHLAFLLGSCQNATGKQSQQQMVADHVQMSSSLDQRDQQELLPQLNSMCKHCSDSLTKCMHVQQLIEEWWEQPAQFLVPGYTYHNQNLHQWTEQFLVLATQWHQKRLLG